MVDDYYSILGVNRNASSEDIQKAYRKLARKHHPDLADDKDAAKEKFQKIQHAYDVLSDDKKRQLYDRWGPEFERAGAGGGDPFQRGTMPPGMEIDLEQLFGGGARGAPGGGFEEILKQVFGGAAAGPGPGGRRSPFGGPPPPTKGQDVEQEITIPFGTAVLGGKYQLSIQRPGGKIESITITIPAGIEHGKKIRLRGQGYASQTGGPTGDLLVRVKVAPHPVFRRSGNDLLITVPVTIAEAALGAKVDLPTPKGKVTLTVPAGSSSGKRLRLKGLGVPQPGGTSGDLLAELKIVMPPVLSDQQRELIKQLGESAQHDPRVDLKW